MIKITQNTEKNTIHKNHSMVKIEKPLKSKNEKPLKTKIEWPLQTKLIKHIHIESKIPLQTSKHVASYLI